MAALEIEGKIRQKLAKINGQGAKGPWTKQDFILEYQDGNFPAEICFTVFGNDKVAELDKHQVGDDVRVSFNLRAREYNGRWYNDVRVWRISSASQEAPAQSHAPRKMSAPAQAQVPPVETSAPAPTIDDMPAEDPNGGDLPF
jgi:hypothetical protein